MELGPSCGVNVGVAVLLVLALLSQYSDLDCEEK